MAAHEEKHPDGEANLSDSAQDKKSDKKPSRLKGLWVKAGLDKVTLILMLKGSRSSYSLLGIRLHIFCAALRRTLTFRLYRLPPVIAIAMYQSDAVAQEYATLGYLVAITSVLGMAILPRGVFVQTMLLNVVAVCIAAAVNLLVLYSATQARIHTTPEGSPPTGYNSSASAVLAVWLVFQVFLTNALRASLPQLQFPVILYSIFAIVSSTYGVLFPSMEYAINFMEMLMEAFLTGFAIATGVSLFVFPISSRQVVFKEFAGYLGSLSALLSAQGAFLQSLETFEPTAQQDSNRKSAADVKDRQQLLMTPEGAKLKAGLEKLYALHTKLPKDISFAKREVAIGKLGPRDITGIWKLIRPIMTPIAGLSAVIDILQRRAEAFQNEVSPDDVGTKRKRVEELHQLMKSLHGPFEIMSRRISAAFQHVLITFELTKPPKKQQDEESTGENSPPGTAGFAEAFRNQMDEFHDSKRRSLREWCSLHDVDLPPNFFDPGFVPSELNDHAINASEAEAREHNRRQLYFALYVEYLLARVGMAALDLVLYADERKQAGALSKSRLIAPGTGTLLKWVRCAFGRETSSDEHTADFDSAGSRSLDLGQAFQAQKDPEHLPPRNAYERIGETIRLIPRAFRSDASSFGFRVSLATMSVGIICYLHDTQNFFLQNRLLWAMIMVPISMTRTAGQSTWSFALRILGTAIAMIASYIIWYIVDGKTAGVIVFLWVWMFCAYYVLLKMPKLIIVGLISAVTAILVIGYELQVRVVGIAASEANGQPAYPTYLLAPYRLATVCGGLAVAYIWTIFPYPVSESTELRKDLGGSLYLLANMYSVVHETVKSRVRHEDGDENVKGTRAYHLEKARTKVFIKLLTLLTNLQQNSGFSKFQLRVGGRFPHDVYLDLIQCVQRVLQYTTLISYASKTFSTSAADSEWSIDFRKLLSSIDPTSHRLTSHLSLLSSSLTHARSLPPYLEVPNRLNVRALEKIDGNILGASHIAEPEYSAYAVISICAACINDDVVKITQHVKFLCGEMDFSFHAVSTTDESSDDSIYSAKENA